MAKKKAGAKSEPLFVKSKIREYIKGNECNTSAGILDGDSLNSIIQGILDKAITRAKANGRKTVKARDL